MLGFNNPKRKFEKQAERYKKDLDDLISSGLFINGAAANRLCERVNHFLNANGFSTCANGTDAITVACIAGDLPKNSKILLPTLSAPASVVGALRANLVPVFIDVDHNGLVDENLMLDRAKQEDISSALIVHLYGNMVAPRAIRNTCSLGTLTIEDCAQAFGSSYDGEFAGSIGHFGTHSFYPTKNLSTTGDGGGISIGKSSNFPVHKLKEISEYGWNTEREVVRNGFNSRLDELHALFLLSGLEEIENQTREKQDIAREFLSALSSKQTIRAIFDENKIGEICPHLFVIRCNEPEKIDELAKKYGIVLGRHYKRALPDHSFFSNYEVVSNSDGILLGQEIAHDGRSLPFFVGMTTEEKTKVFDLIQEIE